MEIESTNFNHMFKDMNELTRVSLIALNFAVDHSHAEYSLQVEVEFNHGHNGFADKWNFCYYGIHHPASRELIELLMLFLDSQALEIIDYLEQIHQKFQIHQEILVEAKTKLAIRTKVIKERPCPDPIPADRDPYLEDLEESINILVLLAQTHGKTAEFDPDTLTDALRALLKSCQWTVPILSP